MQMCTGCLLYSRTSHWWCSAKYTASHTNRQLVWSMIIKCSDFHDTEQPAGAQIIVDDWYFSLHGGALSSQKAAHHLQTAARSQYWPEAYSQHLAVKFRQETPNSLIGNLKPCNLPCLKRLGSAHVGICRTNGTKWGI